MFSVEKKAMEEERKNILR